MFFSSLQYIIMLYFLFVHHLNVLNEKKFNMYEWFCESLHDFVKNSPLSNSTFKLCVGLLCEAYHLSGAYTGYLSFGIHCIWVSCGSSGWITAVTFMAF